MRSSVLVAEDDPRLGAAIARGLREQAYDADLVDSGPRVIEAALARPYDAVILDVMIPGVDGFAVARALRGRGSHVPILMLTARDAVSDRIEGLDAGADDYLVKPFAFDELLARVRALLRRAAELRPAVLTAGALEVDTRSRTASLRGRPIALTAKEYALLEYLAREKGRVVSRADIAGHVWDESTTR